MKTYKSILGVTVLALFVIAWSLGPQIVKAGEAGYGALIKVLPKSKHTLSDGIRQAVAKPTETVISAKFELGDNGKLALSVYTAEKGLNTDAEHNILKELAGSPEAEKWKPGVEVFKDVEHVARSAQQLTLMELSPFSLLDIIAKAEKQQSGTVFSITPIVQDRKPQYVVLVAAQGKAVELRYDLMTGKPMKVQK